MRWMRRLLLRALGIGQIDYLGYYQERFASKGLVRELVERVSRLEKVAGLVKPPIKRKRRKGKPGAGRGKEGRDAE